MTTATSQKKAMEVEVTDSEEEMESDGGEELFMDDDFDGDGENESYDEEDDSEQKHGHEAMGDVISKILQKKVTTDTSGLVLSKSQSTKKKRTARQEEIKAKKAKTEELLDQREMNHVLPIEVNDVPKEARLRRIGTKGVVMLFNAVSTHQKSKAEKMKTAKTEGDKVRVEKSMKKSTFMDMLKNDKKSSKKVKQEIKVKEEEEDDANKSSWNVLKNDFMLGSTLKHWDKDDEEEGSKKKKKNIKETLDVEDSSDEADHSD